MNLRHQCVSISRYLLIVINTCLAILSLAVIALLLWVRFDVNFEHDVRNNIQNTNPNPPDFFVIKNDIRSAVS